MANEPIANAYLSMNGDTSSEPAQTHQCSYDPLTDISCSTQDMNLIRPLLTSNGSHTPESIDQYFDADFGVDELFPNLPHSADEHISNDEWSQHLAPVADYNEDREDDGSMLFADRVGVTDNTAFNTVDIDQAQSSTAISSRSVPSPNIQAPSPCTDSLTSSTPGPLSTPASSSLSYASVPNTTVDSSRYCCNECRISAKTKHDWERHLKTNKHKARGNLSNGSNDNGIPGAAPTKFHCSVEDCKYHESTGRAIAREDNLRRHVKKVHGVV